MPRLSYEGGRRDNSTVRCLCGNSLIVIDRVPILGRHGEEPDKCVAYFVWCGEDFLTPDECIKAIIWW
jgi:hypothetical protein